MAVEMRPLFDVNHVELPEFSVVAAQPGVKFETPFFGVHQIPVPEFRKAAAPGEAGHHADSVQRRRMRRIDVEIDIAVRHQESGPQRTDQVDLGPGLPPEFDNPGCRDESARFLLIFLRESEKLRIAVLFHGDDP